MTKRILFCFCFFMLNSYLSGQVMHIMLFADQTELNREKDRYKDTEAMYGLFKEISKSLTYEPRVSVFSGDNFTFQGLKSAINDLEIRSNDIVVFYFSGHGQESKEPGNRWPNLLLNPSTLYSFSKVVEALQVKATNAKLLLCIADCCNDFVSRRDDSYSTHSTMYPKNVKDLFLGFPGKKTILVSASVKGQPSISSLEKGSFFGREFRTALKEAVSIEAPKPHWENILETAKLRTLDSTKYKQQPQYEIF